MYKLHKFMMSMVLIQLVQMSDLSVVIKCDVFGFCFEYDIFSVILSEILSVICVWF